MVDKKRLIKLTQKLIRINSENPPGDEFEIAHFVKDYLTRLGLETKIYEFKKRRSNVVAILKGKDRQHSLLISPHLDTVPSGKNWRFNPFSGKIYRNRICGLGATDCKGNLACALEAINSIVENNMILDYNLVFAATADEESGSMQGLIPLLVKGTLNPDAAVVLDASDFNIIVAQKGLIHLKVKLWGKRAHGAYPWRGINAIDIAIDILKELKSRKWKFRKNKSRTFPCDGILRKYRKVRDKYLKPPTLNIGTIKGGDKVNVVADWCEFELDFRFLPGMSERKILKDIKNVIGRHTQKFRIEIEGIQKPYIIGEKHLLIKHLTKAMNKLKIKPTITGSEGATVITFFHDKNIPATATGFGSKHCEHTAGEYVKIDNLYKGAQVLEEFLKGFRFNTA